MANISKVTLLDGVTYDLKDSRVDNLKTDEIFIANISVTYDEDTEGYIVTSDKTAAEICAAYSAGKMCMALVQSSNYGSSKYVYYLNSAYTSTESGYTQYEVTFVDDYHYNSITLFADSEGTVSNGYVEYIINVYNFALSLTLNNNVISLKAGNSSISSITLPVYNGGVSSS